MPTSFLVERGCACHSVVGAAVPMMSSHAPVIMYARSTSSAAAARYKPATSPAKRSAAPTSSTAYAAQAMATRPGPQPAFGAGTVDGTHVPGDVDDGCDGSHDEPLGADRAVILTAHRRESADDER